MSLRYVIFRDDPSTHDEVYLARDAERKSGFCSVPSAELTAVTFESAAEGYAFAKHFEQLQHWKVGQR